MHSVTVLPRGESFLVPHGSNLLSVLAEHKILISAPCGGKGSCGKCRVQLRESPDAPFFEALACHTTVVGDLTVLLDEQDARGMLAVSATATPCNGTRAGVLLDIGTTTLAACLVDQITGKTLATASMLNPQAAFGADVLSRITAYANGKGEAMRIAVVDAANRLLAEFAHTGAEMDEMIVAGNPTMLHLLIGADPTGIGAYPFTPAFVDTKYFAGAEIGIHVPRVRLLPSISAYLGSDVSGGVLACEMHQTEKTQLLLDLGTNGEVVLSHRGKLYAASTAAGPALEGANLSCGIGGVSGAVDRVWCEDGQLHFSTVENAPARGICGSGVIDLIALLLNEGILDETGAFSEECNSPLLARIEDDCFYLTPDVFLSQEDVRQFQLAKAAIAAGIEALAAHCNVKTDEIEHVFLAGGLGYYLRPASAARTGLLPQTLLLRTAIVGNTALAGARLCLLHKEKQAELDSLCKETESVELSFSPVFSQAYIENMGFEA